MTRGEAAKMIENDIQIHHDNLSGNYRKALRIAISALEEPERKNGKWIRNHNVYEAYETATCSVCGYVEEWEYKKSYCPECGSYNGGEKE